MRKEEKEIEKKRKALADEQRATDASVKALGDDVKAFKKAKDELAAREARLVEDLKDVKQKDINFSRLEQDLRESKSKHDAITGKLELLAATLTEKTKALEQKALSLEKEKEEIESQKKLVERDRLRVEKLAREKAVEKELEELRKK